MGVGGLALAVALILLFFIWRRKGLPKTISDRVGFISPRHEPQVFTQNTSQPLTVDPSGRTNGGWDYETSFAKPWVQTPRALRKLSARFFPHPLALNPVTPSPSTTRLSGHSGIKGNEEARQAG